MSINSGPEEVPGREPGISQGLRNHIVGAARKIRAAHEAELADVVKADYAGRLFRSMIVSNGSAGGSPDERPDQTGEGMRWFGGELGGLLDEAIRTGTGLVEGPLTALTQAWLASLVKSTAKSKPGASSAAKPAPGETPEPQPPAASQSPGAAVTEERAREIETTSPEEVMLRDTFRRFMPMLLTSLRQGGDGYGLAETVITLFGRRTYDQAAGLGHDKIMRVIKTEPELWAQVAPIEAKFSRFVDEFTRYDAWMEERARQANEP